ncbi:MAG TPA: hypothetical protein VGC79_28120, partial [Polyangiaceae bacterium]
MGDSVLVRSSGALLMAWGLCASGCTGDQELPRGQLIVAFSTDMSVTKDLDEVRVQVFRTDGSALPDRQIPIIPAKPKPFGKPLPGTLAIVPTGAGGEQVRIVVTARKLDPGTGEKLSRVVREAIVKIPTDRTALLPMPLRWLCSGVVARVEGTEDSFRSDCPEDETCVAGTCQPANVDADALPDYTAAAVFGGGNAEGENSRCLDVQTCFAQTEILTPDTADCSVPLPSDFDLASLNVALVLDPETEGHCLDSESGPNSGNCYLPLDADPNEGFRVEGRQIELPQVACERQGRVGVAVSTVCPTKDLSVPVCGPWTGWPRSTAMGTSGSASRASGGMSGSTGGELAFGGANSSGGSGNAASAGSTNSGGTLGAFDGPPFDEDPFGATSGGKAPVYPTWICDRLPSYVGTSRRLTEHHACQLSWPADATGMPATLSFEIEDEAIVSVQGNPVTLPPGYVGPYPADSQYIATLETGEVDSDTSIRVLATHPDSST